MGGICLVCRKMDICMAGLLSDFGVLEVKEERLWAKALNVRNNLMAAG